MGKFWNPMAGELRWRDWKRRIGSGNLIGERKRHLDAVTLVGNSIGGDSRPFFHSTTMASCPFVVALTSSLAALGYIRGWYLRNEVRVRTANGAVDYSSRQWSVMP